ncbi:hypothetical protein BDP27DRAFT_1371207 [Rhodocollybia butyracea]|uniref:Uncharacterized protein n=1 Tax=Rhodocollybia butyracea TaxID=206335 RepID=A0A9P5PAR8_9AGAR|nr:hypothetical protein BDP27DRAFT_1371207 [Rhodocollybia butyracea]
MNWGSGKKNESLEEDSEKQGPKNEKDGRVLEMTDKGLEKRKWKLAARESSEILQNLQTNLQRHDPVQVLPSRRRRKMGASGGDGAKPYAVKPVTAVHLMLLSRVLVERPSIIGNEKTA